MRKTILITGSSRGIGRATALSLTDKQLNVVVNYKEQHEKAHEVVEILRSRGMNAISIQADISQFDQVKKMFDQIQNTYGGVDILVNNAGIASVAFCQDVSVEMWHEIFSVNVDGMFYCTKFALQNMISKKSGVIVNLASIWGQTGGSMESHYSATKGAIMSYTKALASELGPSNIRVNAVAPGGIYTDMIAGLSKAALDAYASEVPLTRIGEAHEIANTIKFLISDDASYITGQIIAVNGGHYMN